MAMEAYDDLGFRRDGIPIVKVLLQQAVVRLRIPAIVAEMGRNPRGYAMPPPAVL